MRPLFVVVPLKNYGSSKPLIFRVSRPKRSHKIHRLQKCSTLYVAFMNSVILKAWPLHLEMI